MNTIDRRSVCDALRELGSIDEQNRLWLSSGANGAEVSSFAEAVEQLYTDTGLAEALECGRTGMSQELNERFRKLSQILKTVNHRHGPSCTIDDPAMTDVRLLANKILQVLEYESATTT